MLILQNRYQIDCDEENHHFFILYVEIKEIMFAMGPPMTRTQAACPATKMQQRNIFVALDSRLHCIHQREKGILQEIQESQSSARPD
jgi:hypothetical protein